MTTNYGERPGLTTREPEPVGPVRLAACLIAVRNGVTLSPLTMFDVCHALEDARADAARLRAALESANAGYLRACAERNGYRIALERIANAPCDTFHGPTDYCPALEARIALGCETEAGKDGAK